MKRKEILMLVCAFFLGFFANAIMKSSCMGKLYEKFDFVDHRDQDVGCGKMYAFSKQVIQLRKMI